MKQASEMIWGKGSESAVRTSHRWRFRVAGVAAFLILAAASVFSQEAADGKTTEKEDVRPPTPVELAEILVPEMRNVLTMAVQGLRQRAYEDPDFFFVSPKRHRTVVDHEEKEITVRYSKKTVERPVYEYETYKTMVNKSGNSEQAAGKLETVTRRRRGKKIGTKKVEKLVRDKEGDIVKVQTRRKPIYGPGGADEHFPGFFAQNAMGLYLCAKAGVPMDDELMNVISHNVANLAMGYGLTDRTWDLAWLTAAMVNMPKDDAIFREASERMVSKLLLGQIKEGRGEGLWGPVSVDPDLLFELIEVEREFHADEIQRWENKLKDNPDRKLYQERMEEAKNRFKDYRSQYAWVSQLGFKFQKVKKENTVKPQGDYIFDLQTKTGMDDGRNARLQGLPFYIYEEQLADVESTSIVLFALREAADNGYLPDQGWVPKTPDDEPLVPPRDTDEAIRSAFAAVAKRVNSNGTADEGNLWVHTNAFEGMAGIDLPYTEDRIDSLESDITFTSSARACMALLDAAAMIDDTKRLDMQTFNASKRTVRAMMEGLLTDDMRGMKVGGHAAPYEFVFHAARAVRNPLDISSDERNLWAWLSEYVLQRRMAPQAEEDQGEKQTDEEESGDAPVVQKAIWLEGNKKESVSSVGKFIPKDRLQSAGGDNEALNKKQRRKLKQRIGIWRSKMARRLRNDVVGTVYAGECLLAGLRPPVAGVWAWDAREPRLATIGPVVKRLSEENEEELAPVVIDPAFPANAATGIPLLMISGSGEFAPAAEDGVSSLIAYLEAGGKLVVEAPATDDGIGFLKVVQKEIAERLPGAETVRLPPMADELPPVVCVRDENGLRAAFLPVAGSREQMRENVFSPGTARMAVYLLLAKSLPDDYFDPQYAIHWDQILDYEEEMLRKREQEE